MKDDEQNPYAPPRAAVGREVPVRTRPKRYSKEGVTAWQDDGRVVMPAFGGELPDRCVVCNRPTDYKVKRTFQWHNPGYYVLICAGWIVYLIVLFFVRKTATVYLGLCDEHEARRKSGVTMTWVGVGAGVFLILVGRFVDAPLLLLVAALGMLVALIVGGRRARVATVWKIDESHVWLKAGPEFVRSLPDSPDGDAPDAAFQARRKKKKRAKTLDAAVDDELRRIRGEDPVETPDAKPAATVDDELRAMLGDAPAEAPGEKAASTPEEKPADEGDEER
jgi:hypothetical protein